MIIGACRLELFLPETHSLKEKRQILRKIIEKATHKFGVPVAEVEFQDLWQRAALGFAVAGSDRRFIQSLLERMVAFIEELDLAPVSRRSMEVLDYGEEELLRSP